MEKAKTYKAPSVAKFKAMTAPQKRVAIAKHVLAMLAAKKYKPHRGKYVANLKWEKAAKQLQPQDDMRSNFDKLKSCQVCAMGSVLMSAIRLQNNVTVGTVKKMDDSKNPWPNSDGMDIFMDEGGKQLKKLFSKDQLATMEIVFEHEDRDYNLGKKLGGFVDYEEAADAEDYGYKFTSANKALKIIMENIIANKGKFVVPKQ